MNNQEALNTLNDIRNMMEKSTRFVSFSGLSSIVIGIYACIAAIIAYSILEIQHRYPDWMSTRLRNYNF